jgi:TetR/AcrR family tetracycline transcriptional repressor
MALTFRPATARPGRRRAAFLTQAEIVAAAAVVLERDGYDALNMRAVAAELGVQAAALYRHVESRAELDDRLFDHLMADCAPKLRGEDWREDLKAVAGAWRRRLLERRDVTRIKLGQISIGPNIAPLMDASLEALQRSGLSDADAVEIYQAYLIVVHGFASAEASYRDLASRPDGLRIAPLRPEWAAAYPTLSRLADRISAPADFETRFAFGLEAFIAGIERRLATKEPRRR